MSMKQGEALTLQETVSRDWEKLKMIEMDKTHLFKIAADRLFLIRLESFKKSPASSSFFYF